MMQHLWSALYAASALASTVACGAIAWRLRARAGRVQARASAVRFVIRCFFFYSWLWSLFRLVFFCAATAGGVYIRTDEDGDGVGSDASDMDDQYLDALGTRGVAQSSEATSAWLSCVIVGGDAALMASSMWMLPMAWELTRLARRSMDRGADREARVSSRYNRWVHALTTLFLVGEAAYTIYNQGFDQQSTRILVSGNMIQALTLVYVAYAILELKFSGRKYEAVQGARVLSPLYKRIRSIMVVYGVFSFQYQVLSLVVLFSRYEMTVPTCVVGISTILFTNTGTALSIFMGCSQECVVRCCGKFMPEEYVREFYAAMDDNSHVICATAPPMDKPVFVFTDIEASTQLWTEDPIVMRTALELHDDIIRSKLARHQGYEITTAGDAFQLAFHTIKDAVEYCFDVQLALLAASWPKKLHDMVPATKRKRSKTNKLVFSGLRVRMGIHDSAQDIESGAALVTNRHPVTGKVTYTGLSEVIASEVGDVGVGGEICVTRAVAHWLAVNSSSMSMTFDVGFIARHSVPQVGASVDVFQVTPSTLDARKKAFAKTRKKKMLEREKDKDKNEVRGRRERLEAIDVMEIAVVTV